MRPYPESVFGSGSGRLVLACTTSVALLAVAGCGGSEREPSSAVPPQSYHLGDEFDGLPLSDVLPPAQGAGGSTSFIYGDCQPSGSDGGCAPPLEVQTWIECSRPPRVPESRLEEVRGALVETDPREARVEVFTGTNTVVIFGTAERASAAVQELRQRDDAEALARFEPPRC